MEFRIACEKFDVEGAFFVRDEISASSLILVGLEMVSLKPLGTLGYIYRINVPEALLMGSSAELFGWSGG